MISYETFGFLPDGREVKLYTLKNEQGACVKISALGATVVSLCVPDKNGALTDVVLGYDTLEEYLQNDGYLGATVGRYCNRIGSSRFTLKGKEYKVTVNDGKNSLHGGVGFSAKIWDATTVSEDAICFSCRSPHGEDGYPANLTAKVLFTLTEDNALCLKYTATADGDTVCNLTNHAYFNLHGGTDTVLSHEFYLAAQKYTDTDAELIPTADVSVEGTAFDFRKAKKIAEPIYDNNFVLDEGMGVKASLYEEKTGILLEMFTDMPGVQVYTSAMLSERQGKNGAKYGKGQGICLETQFPPNGPNRYAEGGFYLSAGETWQSETVYKFGVR